MIGVFVVSVTFTLIYNSLFASSSDCKEAQDFLKDSYNGILLNKSLDQNNHDKIILTITKNSKPLTIILPNDPTFFGFIKTGDSLVKTKNEDFIGVHRPSITTNFKINFDRKENK